MFVASNDPEARRERVKALRLLTKLSRDKLAQELSVHPSTVQSWETGRYNGISRKSAKLLCEYCCSLGITCSTSWILEGNGLSPFATPSSRNTAADYMSNQAVANDLKNFLDHSEETTHLTIQNDLMMPFYCKGDIVAGINVFEQHTKDCINKICIIHDLTGKKFIGYVHDINLDSSTTIEYSKSFSEIKNSQFHQLDIYSIAEVLWMRRHIATK